MARRGAPAAAGQTAGGAAAASLVSALELELEGARLAWAMSLTDRALRKAKRVAEALQERHAGDGAEKFLFSASARRANTPMSARTLHHHRTREGVLGLASFSLSSRGLEAHVMHMHMHMYM